MSDENNDVREGLGCILLVVAIFLFLFLAKVIDPLAEFVQHWLESHS